MKPDKQTYKESPIIRWVIFILFLVLVALMFPRKQLSQLNVDVGATWLQPDLIAPFTFPIYKDPQIYQAQKDQARQRVLPVFRRTSNTFSKDRFQQHIDSVASNLLSQSQSNTNKANPSGLRSDQGPESLILKEAYSRWLSSRSSQTLFSTLRVVLPDEIKAIKSDGILNQSKRGLNAARLVIRSKNDRQEEVFNVAAFRDSIEAVLTLKELLKSNRNGIGSLTGDTLQLALDLAGPFLNPNILYDQSETQLAVERAEKDVPIADGLVRQNEIIIAKGETITPLNKRMLGSYLKTKTEREARTGELKIYLGKLFIVVIITALFIIYLYFFRPKVYFNNTLLLLIFLIFLMELAVIWQAMQYEWISVYIVPVGIAAILFTTLFDSRVGFFGTITIALLAAMILGNDFQFAVVSMFAGGLAVFSIRDIKHRIQIFVTVLLIFLGYVLSLTAFSFSRLGPMDVLLNDIFFGLVNSLLCFLIYPFILLIERFFGLTTDLTLLELSDVNHPLLREMGLNAPGTFHHTMMVSVLSERAAGEIHANQLLCRVGAYFHDIGKTPNPEFFTENQSGNNPHDNLSPENSAKIIISHIIDGQSIGKKYHLPEKILDFIPEHHGTSVIDFFYQKALKLYTEETINKSLYQYPGPKPHSKETAIVMLADSVEASVRSLSDHTEEAISAIVESNIRKRYDEDQFSNCPITFDEINIIKKSFIKTIMAAHHKRIKYPGQTL
jgi:hypothetical protein